MKVYSIGTVSRAFARLAKEFPSSYCRAIRLWFGYDILLVCLVKSDVEEQDVSNFNGGMYRVGVRLGPNKESEKAGDSASGTGQG